MLNRGKVQLSRCKADPSATQVTSALINFQARLSLAGHNATNPRIPTPYQSCYSCCTGYMQILQSIYWSSSLTGVAFTNLPYSLPQNQLSYHASQCSSAQAAAPPQCQRKQLLHQIPIRRKKKVLPDQKPLDSVRGQEPHLQFSSAIVLSCKRRFSGHSAPACLLSLHVFPCTGQAAKQVQQAPLAAAGVPSLMPRLLKQRERGARHGKGSEGAGRELILAISRKETEVLNTLLAEIPSKWEETEPSSGTSPSISDCKTHQPEGISCWPTSTRHISECEGYCKQPGHDRLLLGCMYCFCSCPHFINQHPLLCFFTF